MPYRQLFIIDNRPVGECLRRKTRVHEELHEPSSDLYFCPACGDVWARLPVYRDDGSVVPWQSYRRVCRKCAPQAPFLLTEWPGTIWRSWDHDFLADLPDSVLQRELLRHIDVFEKASQ